MEEIKKSGKPPWLRRKLPSGPNYEKIRQLVKKNHLATVCQEAMCPNQFECYGKGTATFMILGDHCTRNCRFCAVQHGALGPPEKDEPTRVAQAVKTMKLRYAVITSVTRDDMPDGGAHHFAQTIEAIRELSPDTLIEVLIPDLQGNWDALDAIIEAKPDVLNHNLETIKRLYPTVRPQAVYHRSLELLRKVKEKQVTMITKSGMMVGLGETIEELQTAFTDLADARCDILTLGQYLQPSKDHLAVEHYLSPEKFELLKQQALHLGFAGVAAAPFVRSSYQAEELYTLAAKKPAAAS
ncbi:lipoyl synthase [Desulfogranum marinum]|uniref:lipoyl synthase n=1 Tax=Desulfogranum marinum TaxID=453220 RepID=UPI0019629C90|nr:lipoyl synthase [Desulfogranum marinum]MBM9511979.1 lipoyl synthase [Desulfogranum marinum]